MIKQLVSATVLVFGLGGAAMAQPGSSCADAIQIFSDSTVSGDTCASANPIGGFGGLPSPHNDVIYYFDAQDAGATITVSAADFNYAAFLTSDCAGNTSAPTQGSNGPAVGGAFPVNEADGVADGSRWYITVSSNPTTPAATCGTYTLDVLGQLPVQLQSFSVE